MGRPMRRSMLWRRRRFGFLYRCRRRTRCNFDFLRQRSDQRYAGMRQDLADLVNSKLGLAGLDVIGYVATLFELFLGLDLIRYAEALEQLRYVDAARAATRGIDEAYGLCLEHGLLES